MPADKQVYRLTSAFAAVGSTELAERWDEKAPACCGRTLASRMSNGTEWNVGQKPGVANKFSRDDRANHDWDRSRRSFQPLLRSGTRWKDTHRGPSAVYTRDDGSPFSRSSACAHRHRSGDSLAVGESDAWAVRSRGDHGQSAQSSNDRRQHSQVGPSRCAHARQARTCRSATALSDRASETGNLP